MTIACPGLCFKRLLLPTHTHTHTHTHANSPTRVHTHTRTLASFHPAPHKQLSSNCAGIAIQIRELHGRKKRVGVGWELFSIYSLCVLLLSCPSLPLQRMLWPPPLPLWHCGVTEQESEIDVGRWIKEDRQGDTQQTTAKRSVCKCHKRPDNKICPKSTHYS